MLLDVLCDPPWSIVMEGEEVTEDEDVDCWEVGPEEDAPDPLATVTVEHASSIWDSFKFEVGEE